MDVERDIVKFEVIPALNRMFKDKGVDFQAIDLRYGINTSGLSEKEASDKALNMCMRSIDRARPFFLGFVGNRYGTIPENERWQSFYKQLNKEQKAKLRDSNGKSITEMEILYSGLFSNDANGYRYLFCLRDEVVLDEILEEYRANYTMDEDDIKNLSKNQALRSKINACRMDGDGISRFSYSIKADKEHKPYAPDLADKLINAIAHLIDDELENRATILEKQPIWYIEGDEVRARMYSLAEQSIRRPDIEKWIENAEGSTLICGPSFSGKSTLLARLYMKYFIEDLHQKVGARKILLAAVVNHSRFSRNILQMMGRWVVEVSDIYRIDLAEELKIALIEAEPRNSTSIREMFDTIVDLVYSNGDSLHIFIDDLDQFLLSSPGDEQLDWLDDRITVYATVGHDSMQVSSILNQSLEIVSVSDIVEDPDCVFLDAIMRQNYCELPASVRDCFAGKGDSDNKKEFSFLQINTFFKMLRLLNMDDFKEMRVSNMIEDSKVMNLFESLPEDYMGLFNYFVQFFTDRNGSRQNYSELIQLLNDNPAGLRVDEIIDLMDNRISAPEVYNMLYYFDDFVYIEYDTQIVKMRNHPELFWSYYYTLQVQRLENMIMEQASLYQIPKAMSIICKYLGVSIPRTVSSTKELQEHYPEELNANNLMTFVVNAYMSSLFDNTGDIKNAEVYADKALHVATRIGASMDVCRGHIYWAKAEMLNNTAQYNLAKEAGIKAIGIFEQNNIVYKDLPDLYILVGRLFEKECSNDNAIRYYKTALKIMKQTKSYSSSTIESLSIIIDRLLNYPS